MAAAPSCADHSTHPNPTLPAETAMNLLSLAPMRRPMPLPLVDAGDAAANTALAEAPVPPVAAEPRCCGWFDSSWELLNGLAVDELPDSEGTVAALWFAELARGRPAADSTWLQ